MLALLLAATLAQSFAPAPSVGLFLRPGHGRITPTLRESILTSVGAVLAEAGCPISTDAHDSEQRLRQADVEPCSRGIDCLYRVGRTLGVDVLVAVEATDFEGDVAVALEALAPNGEWRLARQSTVVRSQDVGRVLRMQLDPFARELRASLSPRPPDAPLAEGVNGPKMTPDRIDLLERDPAAVRPSRIPFVAAAGAAAIAGGTAVVFGIRGLASVREFNQCSVAGACTWVDADRHAQTANRDFTGALVSAAVSAALTTGAVLLWPKPKE
jgi:hypothetical protein